MICFVSKIHNQYVYTAPDSYILQDIAGFDYF